MNTRAIMPVQRGTSLIEVLVTIVILAFGLLGLVGLQTRLQLSEMESYQRAQALILLNDMASRIATNRTFAANYVTTEIGGTIACPGAGATRATTDLSEWCNALQGAGETSNGNRVGVMIGGRGCVKDVGSGEYMVTVAWQGMGPMPLSALTKAAVTCGADMYDDGVNCVNDNCRRVLTTVVRIAALI